jgi:hypothetical protein
LSPFLNNAVIFPIFQQLDTSPALNDALYKIVNGMSIVSASSYNSFGRTSSGPGYFEVSTLLRRFRTSSAVNNASLDLSLLCSYSMLGMWHSPSTVKTLLKNDASTSTFSMSVLAVRITPSHLFLTQQFLTYTSS